MDGISLDLFIQYEPLRQPAPMTTTPRYAIAIFVRAMISVASLIQVAKAATASVQTEPDYRARTIYFLLGDRFNLIRRR
jgi:hypothetical protein